MCSVLHRGAAPHHPGGWRTEGPSPARHCIKRGRLRRALGEGSEVPEGATEEAGREEPGQAGQVPQEIHHKEQHELRAKRKCRALLRGALSQSKTHRKPWMGPSQSGTSEEGQALRVSDPTGRRENGLWKEDAAHTPTHWQPC